MSKSCKSKNCESHIYNFNKHKYKKHIYFNSRMYNKFKKTYFKLTYNQLLILDALYEDGGVSKKYLDSNKNLRYSEHFGLLSFNHTKLDKIIVSANTNREDQNDIEILLPTDLREIKDYEYMFHTHPATPLPGSRIKDGVLYEFPSISDIFHFVDHYNLGATQGSLVITPEGIYIIIVKNDIRKIKYEDNKKTYNELINGAFQIQEKAIEKYGSDFSLEKFYTEISYDDSFLKSYNELINIYFNDSIKIYLKPRKKDKKTNKWIINSLILPVIPYELK